MIKNLYKPKDGMSNIEIHIAHGCNLTCDSCSHYSNHGHKGNLSEEEFESWIYPWSKKIKPQWFTLMGGEPTLNKKLCNLTKIALECWKSSRIRIITNGFFLDKHPELPELIKKRKVQVRISVHSQEEEYTKKLIPIKKLLEDWAHGYKLSISSRLLPKNQSWEESDIVWTKSYGRGWRQTYKGFGDNMMPFEDKNPRKSWEFCSVKFCPQIFLGKLWKCPNLAYLQMQDKKFNLNEKWLPYLGYRTGDLGGQALEPNCTFKELKNFYNTEDIFHCSMCPASQSEHQEMKSPLIPVSDLLKNNDVKIKNR
jgi:hypothetical protein